MNLLAVLRAELLKLRGTLALWMCLIAPGLVVAMTVLQIAFRFSKPVDIEPHDAWMMLARAIESLWAFLMLPLFLTLEAALLAAVEHGNQQWKHLFALPVPRYRQLTAKWLVLTALLIAASLLIQENCDDSARLDLENWLNRLVPENDPLYTHTLEGADDMPAHIKSALTATHLSIPFADGQLLLGTWQGIYVWEHRHARGSRQVVVHL